jgi:hypothetical protein
VQQVQCLFRSITFLALPSFSFSFTFTRLVIVVYIHPRPSLRFLFLSSFLLYVPKGSTDTTRSNDFYHFTLYSRLYLIFDILLCLYLELASFFIYTPHDNNNDYTSEQVSSLTSKNRRPQTTTDTTTDPSTTHRPSPPSA